MISRALKVSTGFFVVTDFNCHSDGRFELSVGSQTMVFRGDPSSTLVLWTFRSALPIPDGGFEIEAYSCEGLVLRGATGDPGERLAATLEGAGFEVDMSSLYPNHHPRLLFTKEGKGYILEGIFSHECWTVTPGIQACPPLRKSNDNISARLYRLACL
ncbi:MAG: hypothetical protein QF879_20425, partial [Candidatus Latescibacteria bacterium]|nr:hypothetical protein [Candidatus Latescibacterota bacterium]